MCVSCGCALPDTGHADPRNITAADLRAAADAASTTLGTVAHNIESFAMHHPAEAAKSHADVQTRILKSADEQRYTLGVAYPANRADLGRAADGFRDFAGPDALRKAAWSYMRKGARIGLHHADGTDGAGTVVESYLWPEGAPDWQVGDYAVKSNDWLIGVVWEPEAWSLIKSGRVRGFSPQGAARRRRPSAEALANLRS